ncbi:MAG: PorT family protein [Bacteroidia bacterium]|nr:PorT family protein [Bacteroidia bacterium]NND52588.1 PorT family protein [Flavobacteriaceae bacterium]
MNRLLNIIVLSLIISSFSFAQNVKFGIKAGGNLAKFTNNDDLEFKFGPHFGALANIAISDQFSLQPELLYSAQGYRQNFNGQKVRAKVDYFNLPFLASYEVTNGLILQAGPQIGINIRNDLDVDGQEQGSIFVNDIDISAAFGFQYFIDETIFTQLRGTIGISEVVSNLNDQRHFVLSLSLGLMLDKVEQDEDLD